MTIKDALQERAYRLKALSSDLKTAEKIENPEDVALLKGALEGLLVTLLDDIRFEYYSTEKPIQFIQQLLDLRVRDLGE